MFLQSNLESCVGIRLPCCYAAVFFSFKNHKQNLGFTDWVVSKLGLKDPSPLLKIYTFITHPLIFARFYFTSGGAKSQDSYHTITPVCVDICPLIISVEKKQSQRKKVSSRVSPFYLNYFTWEKNKVVL